MSDDETTEDDVRKHSRACSLDILNVFPKTLLHLSAHFGPPDNKPMIKLSAPAQEASSLSNGNGRGGGSEGGGSSSATAVPCGTDDHVQQMVIKVEKLRAMSARADRLANELTAEMQKQMASDIAFETA
eukprot:1403070-Prymnesium_polylepis.1